MEQIESIVLNLTGYPLDLIISSLLVISIAWFISQNAKNIIPKFMFTGYGIYLILSYPIISIYTLIGIGLMIPHIAIVSKYLVMQFLIIKQLSINSYVFFLTLYYKFLNLLKWIISFFKSLIIFFTTFDFRKAKNSYEKENPKEDFEEKYKSYYKQKDFYKNQQSKTYQKENTYQEEQAYQQKDTHQEKEEKTYQKEQYYKEEKAQYSNASSSNNPYGKEFNQFYLDNSYSVLGASTTDDKKTIKKTYMTLAKKYHPDKNSNDEFAKYNEIFQLINNAYQSIGG